jgi:hypothetical protein
MSLNNNLLEVEEYCKDNEDDFIAISREYNIDKEMLKNAYKIVKQFIIEKSIIIFGGLAIDYALRLKGTSIYNTDELPDYDCLSDRNVDDAYDLAEILFNTGFENVKVIRAKHPETMRVRINLLTVADIRYIPTEYYQNYKTLIYKKISILHPDIQRLDIHRALSFPLQNTMMEDIFHRWEKDIKRFNLYEQYYPITMKEINVSPISKEYTLPEKITNKKYALYGFMAYAMYCKEFKKIYKQKVNDIQLHSISFTSSNTCIVEIPIDLNLLVITDKSTNINKITHNNIIGLIPEYSESNNIITYYTDLLSIVEIDNIQVVNIQYLLLYFLFNYNFYTDEKNKIIFGNYYIYTLRMINYVESISESLNAFMPSITYLGQEPMYEPINPELQSTFPVNYTPSKIGTRRIYDYNNYKISGKQIV